MFLCLFVFSTSLLQLETAPWSANKEETFTLRLGPVHGISGTYRSD